MDHKIIIVLILMFLKISKIEKKKVIITIQYYYCQRYLPHSVVGANMC